MADTDVKYITKASVPKPDKYKTGENFSRFCRRFQQWVTLSQLVSTELYLYFVNMLDSQTYERLIDVELTGDEKADASKFCKKYEKTIYPPGEARAVKSQMLTLLQSSGENIADFAFRTSELSHRAYPGVENNALRKEMSINSFLNGLAEPQIKVKIQETDKNLETLEEVVDSRQLEIAQVQHLAL